MDAQIARNAQNAQLAQIARNAQNAQLAQMKQIHVNLYRQSDTSHFRLFAKGVTPDGWLIAPVFKRIEGIEAATGKDVYGGEEIQLETGEIRSGFRYIKY